MSDEERIIELPERPHAISTRPSKPTPAPSRRKYPKTAIPSSRRLRDEDVFQRFHIIREITMIKGRYQTAKGNVQLENSDFHELVAKSVMKGDVIGLKACCTYAGNGTNHTL
jgi:hypothetical protein